MPRDAIVRDAVVLDHGVVDPVQPEPADRDLLVLRPVDHAAELRHLELAHRRPPRGPDELSARLIAVDLFERRGARGLQPRLGGRDGLEHRLGRDLVHLAAAELRDCRAACAEPCSPATAAFTMLIWFEEPSDFDRMSLMPGALDERADRAAGDDAGPGRGGLQQDAPAPASPIDLVRDRRAHHRDLEHLRARASSTPLAMAAGTSLALP